MLSVFVCMFVFLFLCREERKGDSFNCTVFDLPVNCTAKYTSPSAEFWTYVNSIFIGLYSINTGFEHHRSICLRVTYMEGAKLSRLHYNCY